MSITKSYNKYTNTYYAYDTTYVWDEKTKRKVQKKVCIGKYDPETGAVVPNAKRGRPSKQMTAAAAMERNISKIPESVSSEISAAIAFHTVHGVVKARILKWFAIPFSSGPCFIRK